jgi:hypothetical protein
MEMIEKGLALEELEVHTAQLLPDRLEMRRHGSSIRKNRKRGFECSPTNNQIADFDNDIDQDIQCFRITT